MKICQKTDVANRYEYVNRNQIIANLSEITIILSYTYIVILMPKLRMCKFYDFSLISFINPILKKLSMAKTQGYSMIE